MLYHFQAFIDGNLHFALLMLFFRFVRYVWICCCCRSFASRVSFSILVLLSCATLSSFSIQDQISPISDCFSRTSGTNERSSERKRNDERKRAVK